jgi:hypothetical protein
MRRKRRKQHIKYCLEGLPSVSNVENIAVVAVVAVENQPFLSHLQRLVIVKMHGNEGFAGGNPVQPHR